MSASLSPDSAEPSSSVSSRATEAAIGMAFDHSRDMMLMMRVETAGVLRVVAVNRTYVEVLSAAGLTVSAAELCGMTFDGAAIRLGLSVGVREVIRERFASVIASLEPLEFDETTPVSGGVFHGRTTLIPIVDAVGACGHVLYSSRDVSAQRKIEHDLEKHRTMLANLLGNISGMAYRCRNDEHWTMEFVSEGIRELAGYAPENVVGNRDISWELVVHPDDRASVRAEFERKAVAGLRCEATYRIVAADGSERWVLERALAIGDGHGGIGFYEGIITDITELKRAELAVVEKERTLSAILEHSVEFVGLLDAQGRLLRSNHAALAVVGVTQADVTGRHFWDTPWWAGQEGEQAKLREAVQKVARGEFVRFQTRHPTADGRVLDVDFSLNPVFDDEGRVTLMIPEGRDITDFRRAQEALRRSEDKFHRAFNGSPNIICISRLSDGRVLDVNEAFAREFGVPVAEACGKTSLELGIWDDERERDEFLARLGRDGRVRDLFRERHMALGWRSMSISVEPIEIDGEACLLTTSVDVTAQTLAERALRDSEEKFSKAFRSSPYSLTISDRETGRYLDINEGFERLSGFCRDEVVGRTSLELDIWIDATDRDAMLRAIVSGGSVRAMEVRFRAKSGEIVYALCNVEPIMLGGRQCLLSAVEDITARRRVEEQRAKLEDQLRQNQKLEALGTLAGGIAHDFNNILTAIIVNQELALMDGSLGAETRGRIDAISRASNRAKNLVRQILTFSRKQPVARRRQSLAPLVTETLSFVRASLPSSIFIEQTLAPDTPVVCVDENQVHQVIMNLCTNAAQAMKGGGRMTIRLSPTVLEAGGGGGLPAGRYARLTVSDTGHGMDEAVLARIFEPFFTTKGPGEGTGLGLPLVHGIMRDHEGGVQVNSRPGEGTRFDLYFPEDREAAEQVAEVASVAQAGRGESLLLVDDEPAIAEAMTAMLRKLGYRVEKFTDAPMALERFTRAPYFFDLIIVDGTMPALGGVELIARARLLRPRLPALLMTGLRSGDGAQIESHGVLDKPVEMPVLSRAVRRALDFRTP